jgi:hypothetical protein
LTPKIKEINNKIRQKEKHGHATKKTKKIKIKTLHNKEKV